MSADKPAVLEAAVPILSVADFSDALEYYERVLGFRVEMGEPPRLASVCRNRV
jgi:catechol 2,3-dioxygenase-like lactoylglutathione lyase family enzyme